MTNGWIKLHRSLLQWEWWDDINTTRLWITILLHVTHEPKTWRGIEIQTGEMVTSYRKLAKMTGLSVQSVRTCLSNIESTHEITLTPTHNHTAIKVVNWAKYQGIDDIPNTQPNTDLPQKSTTNKNKEIKNIRKKNIFIHPTLAEVTAYCKERHNNVDPQTFIDFYESKGWMVGKNKMKDWKACVRTWEKSRKSGHVVIEPPDYIRTYAEIEESLKEEDLPF